jgi:putative ABC transport system substrate-binding protein
MRRRELITFFAGAVAWSLAVRAEQPERMPRIGVLMGTADDPEDMARLAAFLQELQTLGWSAGRKVQIDHRWGAGDAERIRKYAAELVALGPDVLVANGNSNAEPLRQATRTVPIVFVNVSDPVGGGLVASLSHPAGNATGFASFEYGMTGKWAELLKEVSPRVTRVAVIRNPSVASGTGQLGAIQAVAPLLGMEVTPIDVRDVEDIERAIAAFATSANGGLIVTIGTLAQVHRESIILAAARHRLPAVYPFRFFITSGGLVSYGPDSIDAWRRAAGYVDRILKGEKPADLPVQAPVKYELAINLKTAKALGLEISPILLSRADEVIE